MSLPGVVTFLTKQLPRYGSRSGYYSQVVRAARDAGAQDEAIAPQPGLAARLVGKLFSTWLRCPPRDQSLAFAGRRFRLAWQLHRGGVFHVLNLTDPTLRARLGAAARACDFSESEFIERHRQLYAGGVKP